MNKSAIKGFSIRARRKLIQDITQKAFSLGIKGDKDYEDIEEFEGGFRVKLDKNQTVYPKEFKSHREKLITEINRKGYEQVIEEVAYTWFNRIIAIRFMEINEYLPVKVRILSSETEGNIEPDVLTNVYDYVDELELEKDKVFELKESHKDEELFKYIFIRECNKLGTLMPQVFEQISDFTELLLPDQLLSSNSVIKDMIESIEEEDFREEVEIIGWMYQYYISEKKDEVFAALKKNKKITKENIPAATQLFTPKWIVKYMTENSLGRLWQESHPNEELKKKWEYFIEPAEQEDKVQRQLDEFKNSNLSPEEIKILDPAMGSGHILVHAFDVMYDIYLSRGYTERDIPQLILEKNLYGLDIDNRAAQLAIFALLMKARSKNRRLFRENFELNICSIQESNGFSKEALKYLVNPNETQIEKFTHLKELEYLVNSFIDAKEYGSIINVEHIDYEAAYRRLNSIINGENLNMFEYGYRNEIMMLVPSLLKQAKIMSLKYDVVISNPPYIGNKGLSPKLREKFSKEFNQFKADAFSVFIVRNLTYAKANGHLGFMTPFVWMFIKTYEKLRNHILETSSISSLVQLEYSGFDEATVPICTFTLKKCDLNEYLGDYIKLSDFKGVENQPIKVKEAIADKNVDYRYKTNSNHFYSIPSQIIAYWLSDKVSNIFENSKKLADYASPKNGLSTTDNKRFVRLWSEVDYRKIGFNFKDAYEAEMCSCKWFPYNKGGYYRKWYGNNGFVVDWENNGKRIKKAAEGASGGRIVSEDCYFKRSISWSKVTSAKLAVRFFDEGYLFDVAGPSIFADFNTQMYLLAVLNSKLNEPFVQQISPTLNFEAGQIAKLPIIYKNNEKIIELVQNNINLCREDWDSYETSWDFEIHPLVEGVKSHGKLPLKKIHKEICLKNEKAINDLKFNEEMINNLLAEIYDLKEEICTQVSEKDVSISRRRLNSDIKSLISYAVGCIFGRYSTEKEGIAYAGGDFEAIDYKDYEPVKDNLLLITEEDYVESDIVYEFNQFIKKVFGKEHFNENLRYIAEVINPNSKVSPVKVLRNYFAKEFYKDHVLMYKKRPIYWMIDSGNQNGVKALFYMHRYDKSTVARFRTDYLHEFQRYYENDIELTKKTNDKKRVDKLKKKLQEVTDFDKVVAHIAHQQIEFDLDDGVEHNYELFQGIEVPQGDGSTFKANLLAKRK